MFAILLFLTVAYALIPIPQPNGTYAVGLGAMQLVDTSRDNPYASDHSKRAVVISAFYPNPKMRCRQACTVPYMPPATAAFYGQQFAAFGVPNGTVEQLQLQVCCDSPKHRLKGIDDYPVVLFSPGLGTSRLLYNIVAQSVSSSGYIVVTIDHPHDAQIVEFPDGSVVYGNLTSLEEITASVDIRARDASFVLTQLGIPSVIRKLIPGSNCGLNSHRAVMFGHSLGGATTASTMLNDSRILGGVNMDGSLFDPVVEQGLDRPFFFMDSEGHTRANDTTYAAIWPHLRGWKREIEVQGSRHNSYTDLPILADVLGLSGRLPLEAVEIIGTVGGFRMLEILTTYLSAFFTLVFNGSESQLLDNPSPLFPEVVFVP